MHPQYTPRTPYICQQCGKEFFRDASRAKYGGGKHCSRACYQAHGRAKHTRPCGRCGAPFFSYNKARLYCSQSCSQSVRIGAKAARWQGKTLTTQCVRCGTSFTVKASLLARGKGKYCTRACYEAGRAQVTRTCAQCGQDFLALPAVVSKGRGIFCSQECAMRGRTGPLAGGWRGGPVSHNCHFCGQHFEANASRTRARFCSPRCHDRYRTHLNGRAQYGGALYRQWRTAVFTRDNFTCQHCSTRGGQLHAHHLASWASTPALRYTVANGLTLCASCHGKLHVFPLYTRVNK